MEDNDSTACILFTCPHCKMTNVHDTQICHDEDYDENKVPTAIAIDVIGEQLQCANCDTIGIVGGTHPLYMTLILYEQMKEEEDEEHS